MGSRNTSVLSNTNSHHTIELANAMGQTVLTTSQDTFDISHLPAGAYYARVMKNGQVVHTQVLRKQ
ncbi:T9SS type A sorting domain-containing protein [Bergeyella zoohelcum]|uniref:T9SS type A sorting domain-containing protein n=1 Tax=Bergeyella zoohelcum TaxID=1015 RepID=UPI003735C905